MGGTGEGETPFPRAASTCEDSLWEAVYGSAKTNRRETSISEIGSHSHVTLIRQSSAALAFWKHLLWETPPALHRDILITFRRRVSPG